MALLFLVLFAGVVSAQPIPVPYSPLAQVREFLQLTDSQVQSILANNDEYDRFASEEQSRIAQVQREIVEETAKSPLDPNALGIRYAEIETICREMTDRAKEFRAKNLDVLNDAQKAKVKVLEDAIKLAPVISEAGFANLAGDIVSAPYAFAGSSVWIGAVSGGTSSFSSGACYSPFPWFDTTSFAATPRRATASALFRALP